MSIRVGTAPDSWGVWFPEDDKQTLWSRCLDEMEKAGYEGVELGPWGYLPNTYDELNKELSKRKLTLVAGNVGGNYLDDNSINNMLKTVDEVASLMIQFPSAKYVVMLVDMYTDLMTGEDVMSRTLSEDEWETLYNNVQRVSDHVRKFGLIPTLHPHVDCHIETEEEIEKVLKNTNVDLCLDTGHHIYGGGEPISFYKKHKDRIPYVHVKDCDMKIKAEMDEKGWSFAKAVKKGIMTEPGKGSINFKELFDYMKDHYYDGWVVVEQDLYPVDNFDVPYPIAKRTREYLRSVGI